MDRTSIKQKAKEAFLGQYGRSIAAYLMFILFYGVIGGVLSGIIPITFLITLPAVIGFYTYFILLYTHRDPDFGNFLDGFSRYGRSLGGMLWMELWIFLWSLLFLIPGIVKAYAYRLTPYILADCPRVSATGALEISMRMTQGHKWEIFVMELSFLGWNLLSVLTFGILDFLYVGPYIQTAMAGMYHELKVSALLEGRVSPEELEY